MLTQNKEGIIKTKRQIRFYWTPISVSEVHNHLKEREKNVLSVSNSCFKCFAKGMRIMWRLKSMHEWNRKFWFFLIKKFLKTELEIFHTMAINLLFLQKKNLARGLTQSKYKKKSSFWGLKLNPWNISLYNKKNFRFFSYK